MKLDFFIVVSLSGVLAAYLPPISQVAPIFSILKLRFCYKNQYVEAYTGH